MNDNSLHWWPLCFSENIPSATTSNQPVALFWGEQELAVYRDKSNTIRAVEDRCPHRRAPLSLGKVTENGHIKCGYHGWTFDGESGDISGFPNLDEGERLPKCKIQTFPLREHNGVIYIAKSDSEQGPSGLNTAGSLLTKTASFFGHATYGLSREECIVAVLDNPALFIDIVGVEFLDKSYGDPRVEQGQLIAERAARWNLIGESRFYLGPLRHRADFPLLIQTLCAPVTGETRITLCRQNGQPMGEIELTFTASTRGMTTVHWRSDVNARAWGKLAPLISIREKMHCAPITLKQSINASQLASTLPKVGKSWRLASAALTPQTLNQEALC